MAYEIACTYFVFEVLRDSLLTISHSFIFDSSLLIKSQLLLLFSEQFMEVDRVVSSAYIVKLNTALAALMSFTYIMNRSGPNIDPCGTPMESGAYGDR